jgi:hypothetical protein
MKLTGARLIGRMTFFWIELGETEPSKGKLWPRRECSTVCIVWEAMDGLKENEVSAGFNKLYTAVGFNGEDLEVLVLI